LLLDGSEISIDDLLEKYFFNKEHHYTSCSVIFTKLHNNTIEQYSIVNEEQTKYNTEKLDETDKPSQQDSIKKSYE